MKQFLVFILTIVIFSSCTFDEHFEFNKDWSGSYKATLDFSEMAAFGNELQENEGEAKASEEILPEEKKEEFIRNLNSKDGISKADLEVNEEEYTVTFSFDYDGLDALNDLKASDFSFDDDSNDDVGMANWIMTSKGKKKFFMTLDPNDQTASSEEMDQAGELLKISTTLAFAKPIKSFTGEMAQKGDKANEIIISYDAGQLNLDPDKWAVSVVLE